MSRSTAREFEDAERAMYHVQREREGNMHCADCGTQRPEYVNLTLGTFVCKECADVHRNISNRRIKDILGRDLTMEDVRRMENVGNDVANKKFLATWDPREFPEPKRDDKDGLKNFIWLKYDGAWKKAAPPPQSQRQHSGRSDQYYGHADDRGRGAYGRERELFRDSAPQPPPPPPPQPQRSFWADRVGQGARPPPPTHDDFRRGYSNSSQQNRFGRAPSNERPERHDRFRSPAPPAYGRGPEPGPRYDEAYDEEYDRHERGSREARGGRDERGRRDERSDSRRRDGAGGEQRVSERSRRKKSEASRYASEEEEVYSEDSGDLKRKGNRRRGNAADRKSKSSKPRRKKVVEDDDESDGYSDDSEESEEDYASRSKKQAKKKKASKKNASKREGRKSSSKRDVQESSEEESEDDEVYTPPSTHQKSSRRSKGRTSTSVSLVTNPFEDSVDEKEGSNVNDLAVIKPPTQAKAEFDLMSDWMGGETDATTVQSTSSTQTAALTPQPAAQQPAAPQPGMQVPMMAPPMSMYGGMMPATAAAYMTGMPMMTPQGYMPMGGMSGMPPMGMPGMYGMPGMPQMGGVPNMGGMQPMPIVPQGGVNGLVNGMQNMGLQSGMQPAPPPPPPAGVSGGHPVGPPPGPPPN